MSNIRYVIEDGSRTFTLTAPPPQGDFSYVVGDRAYVPMPDGSTTVLYQVTRLDVTGASAPRYSLYTQQFDSAGNAIGSATQIAGGTNGNTVEYRDLGGIAFDDGSFALYAGQLSLSETIFDFAANGTLTDTYQPNGSGPTFPGQLPSDIIRLADGGLQAFYNYDVWPENPQIPETNDVRVVTMDGGTVTYQTFPADAAGDQENIQAAQSTDGALVIWLDNGPQGGDGTFNLIGQRLDASGAATGSIVTIAAGLTGTTLVDVFALEDGSYAVTWQDEGLHVQHYTADGQPTGSEVIVPGISGTGVTVLPDGAILWTHDGTAPTDRVVIELFDAAGDRLGDPIYGPEQSDNFPVIYDADTGQLFINGGSSLGYAQYVYDLPDRFFGTPNPDTLTGGAERDILIGYDADDTLSGLLGDDQLDGGNGNDTLLGGGGADMLWGEAGNDTLNGGLGDDTIYGGNGTDVAVFSGNSTDYSIERLSDGSVQITGLDGTDTLFEVERAQFDDGTINIGLFGDPTLAIASFGYSDVGGGWSNNTIYPRTAADVNGDGNADVVGFGAAGVYIALADGNGGFGAVTLAYQGFGTADEAGGWTDADRYPRALADVNGDGNADLVGFGAAGTYVALSDGNGGFGATVLATANFGTSSEAGGWADADRYPRVLGDVNGDGMADIVGFGVNGAYVALGQSDGTFGASFLGIAAFGEGESAGAFTSNDRYPRMLADVNGDGRADIVGFGGAGTYVSLGQTDGTFGDYFLATSAFGTADGWSSNDLFPRQVGDVNGDGRADIIGFGEDGVYVAFGETDGTFGEWQQALNAFGSSDSAGGWATNDQFPRIVADVNGDGQVDLIGFGADGTFVALTDTIPVI